MHGCKCLIDVLNIIIIWGVPSRESFVSSVAFACSLLNKTIKVFLLPPKCVDTQNHHWQCKSSHSHSSAGSSYQLRLWEISCGMWPTVLLFFKKATAKSSWIYNMYLCVTWIQPTALLQRDHKVFVNMMTMNSALDHERQYHSWLIKWKGIDSVVICIVALTVYWALA